MPAVHLIAFPSSLPEQRTNKCTKCPVTMTTVILGSDENEKCASTICFRNPNHIIVVMLPLS